jgi:hypothetical protein
MLNIAEQLGIRNARRNGLPHIGLETIPAAAALRKLRRVSVGGSPGMVQSV